MKNNTFFKLFIIVFVGFALRLWCLDKPEGLWNDEYVGWFIASISNFKEFFNTAIQNCHTPLYYFYLKFWMYIFPDTDLSLRWSSIVPSIISIISMYLVGLEAKDKRTGLFCALFTAISSFCIYFAQEVRLYSLLFLITSVTVLFFIKTAKNQNCKNYTTYFCFNAILCATHTLGIIFSFFNIACLLLYINNNVEKLNKQSIKNILKYIIPFFIVIIIISPFLVTIATSKNLSQFWSDFSLTKIICTFIDYYSPIQTNIQNTFDSFSNYLIYRTKANYSFIIFAILPTIIGLILTIKGILTKNKLVNYLAISAGLFFLTIISLSILGKMIVITKYTIEIYPILILLLSIGLISIKKEVLRNILLSILLLINAFYLYFAEDSAPRRNRPEGHLAVVNLIEESNLQKGDKILITYYNRDKFDRYLKDKNEYNFLSINKFDFNYFLFDGENYFDILKTAKSKHKDFFKEFPNSTLKKYANDKILYGMEKGDRVGIIILKNVSFIDNDNIQRILNDENKYNDTSLIFLVFSSIKNNLVKILDKELTRETTTHKGDWSLYVYIKEN